MSFSEFMDHFVAVQNRTSAAKWNLLNCYSCSMREIFRTRSLSMDLSLAIKNKWSLFDPIEHNDFKSNPCRFTRKVPTSHGGFATR